MTGRDEFDVIVMGGGPAGETAAGRCAQGGLSVALVEKALVGGECSFWACMPSKSLLRPGEALASARRVPGAREAVRGELDAGSALKRRDEVTNNWDDASQARWLEQVGARLFRGTGRFSGPRQVEVKLNDGSSRVLTARRAVVVATGSAAAVPPIPGLRDIRIWESRDATAAKRVPRRLLVLGGGVAGVELAQAFRRLGSAQVVVVERMERLLSMEEAFAGEALQAAFTQEGIDVRVGASIERVQRPQPTGPVVATLGGGQELEGDEILVTTGRRANTASLGLETVGLSSGKPLSVDAQLRVTGVEGGWLYAVGDVNGLALLTHMGKYQARIAADVILGRSASADHRAVPRVVFTDPQVAAVGLTEAQARDQGFQVRTVRYNTADVAGAYVRGEASRGQCQLVVDGEREILLGASFVGGEIGELLHSATIAIVAEVPLQRLWHAVPSFPTVSEVWLRLLETYGL